MVKLIICTLRQILCIGLIKSKQGNMGEVCSTYGRDEKCIQNLSRKNLMGWDSFEYIGSDVRIVLK